MDGEQSKRCTKCGIRKPMDMFSARKRARDGKSSQCKACDSKTARKLQERRRAEGPVYTPPLVKQCRRCGEVQPSGNFHKRTIAPDGLSTWCKQCKQCDRESRRRSRGELAAVANARRFTNDLERYWKVIVGVYGKKCPPCEMCGVALPEVCYDFHHTDPGAKLHLVHYGRCSKAKFEDGSFEAEMRKCIRLCANCHRLWHHVNSDAMSYQAAKRILREHEEGKKNGRSQDGKEREDAADTDDVT